MNASLIAYVNGEFLPLQDAKVSILDRGLVLGDGLFETLKAKDGKGEFVSFHYSRLKQSCAKLHLPLPFSKDEFCDVIAQLEDKNQLGQAVVRFTLTRGIGGAGLSFPEPIKPTVIITYSPVPVISQELRENGVKLCVSSIRVQAASGFDSGIKSTNYLTNIMAKHEADQQDCYDAVFLGEKGELAEMTTASLFVWKGEELHTPKLSSGILPGITRNQVLEVAASLNIKVVESDLFLADSADWTGVFLTSSIRGVLSISSIGEQSFSLELSKNDLIHKEYLTFSAKYLGV